MAEGKSAWAYVGSSCLTLALVAAALVVAGGFWLHRSSRSFERMISDPRARSARVMEVLGAERLPAGYHAMLAFRIPFRAQVAILSDRATGPDGRTGSLGERGLIFIQSLDTEQDPQAIGDYFKGHTNDPGVLSENRILLEPSESVGRGVVELDQASLLYLAQRGKVAVEGYHAEGLFSLILVECPEQAGPRIAVWFVPEPSPAPLLEETDLDGTPADPEAIAAFMNHFRLCAPPAA